LVAKSFAGFLQSPCSFPSISLSETELPMGRTGTRQRLRGEELPQVEEIEINPEEVELSDFLDGLGPQGISEVSLYRVLPSGKQRFITSGPPSQFSEQYVQVQFGEGDYLARAKLNGRWFKSKSFSVEGAPGTLGSAAPVIANHDAELERLKAQIESQRLEMERDRQSREQRNHELHLKMLEALGGRENQAGPSLSELINSVEALRNIGGNGGGLAGFKEVLEIADRINALRGNESDEGSWLGVLKSVAPEIAQTVTQILVARSGSAGAASSPPVVMPAGGAKPEVATTTEAAPLPTAYDQVAGQLRGLLERLQAQIKAGLEPAMAVETLIALEANNDPIAGLILNAVEKSPTFESWLTWLRSQIGASVVIEQSTIQFLSKVFETVKSLPDSPGGEGE
jgi:hypothetical protein